MDSSYHQTPLGSRYAVIAKGHCEVRKLVFWIHPYKTPLCISLWLIGQSYFFFKKPTLNIEWRTLSSLIGSWGQLVWSSRLFWSLMSLICSIPMWVCWTASEKKPLNAACKSNYNQEFIHERKIAQKEGGVVDGRYSYDFERCQIMFSLYKHEEETNSREWIHLESQHCLQH